MKRVLNGLFTIVCLSLWLCMGVCADAPTTKATILFTHDLHSHFLPALDENGAEYGGYARLKTVIDQQREKYPNAILVDGGDFSMGSLFQTAYTTSALELRMMGQLGYDATTFGNHEFDYLPSGLVSMLNAAVDSGDPLPALVTANYLPPAPGEAGYDDTAKSVWNAMERYGVEKDYLLLERSGVYYVIFGLTGWDSDKCAPNSGMIRKDPIQTAQRIADEARAYCWDTYGVQPLVICLSHSGTSGGEGEDYQLAETVTGIDLIVSGHTHITLNEPIQVNNTWIVSAGEYGRYLGVVTMDYKPNGEMALTDYELIPVDGNVEDDTEIAALVESYKGKVEKDYLSRYGMTFDQILTHNPYVFDTVGEVYATQHESTLANVFSDAYKWAAEQADGVPVDIALTAAGVIRESLPTGDVTVSDVFNAASLGVGTEGELVSVYVTGKDLKNVMEVDATVQPLMRAAQLFCSGVEYSFNTNRMFFNKVDSAFLRRNDGTLEEIQDDKLYRLVTGMYCGEMLGAVESTSYGLLTVTPRDAEGNVLELEDLSRYVVRDAKGDPVKEWYAIASYLEQMGGEMDEQYSQPDGRKVVYSSLNPVKLLKNANKFTVLLLAAVLLLVGVLVAVCRFVCRRKKRK